MQCVFICDIVHVSGTETSGIKLLLNVGHGTIKKKKEQSVLGPAANNYYNIL